MRDKQTVAYVLEYFRDWRIKCFYDVTEDKFWVHFMGKMVKVNDANHMRLITQAIKEGVR